jgi:hypothetical protein
MRCSAGYKYYFRLIISGCVNTAHQIRAASLFNSVFIKK